ncbi:MAG: glycosyltransferase, partial [Gammaproteobacteria bacterium]|nr:glycosyltransferase [Gammaproteobacteria bacterium]
MEAYRTPVVSIILPAYNAENYIGEAVLSVFRQTLENWELIIVNDGSKDGTRDYLDTITDLRIKIIHQDNRG